MSEAAVKSSSKASASGVERRPRGAENPAIEACSTAGALQALHAQGGNRAVTHTLSGGTPLPPDIRAEMESRFGASFDAVRVHNDSQAHNHADDLRADAYTSGNHVFFNANRFAPHSTQGRQLLAHELAHVVQQSRGGAMQPRTDGSGPLEAEADQASKAVAQGQSAQVTQSSAPGIAASPWSDRWERAKHAVANPGEVLDAAKEKIADAPEQLRDAASSTYDKASATYDKAATAVHNAAYNFDATQAEKLSDKANAGPVLIIKGLDALADKAKDSPTWATAANNLRNTVKPVAVAFRDANRDVMRETFVGKGFQAGVDSGVNRVDEAVQGVFQRYEQDDFHSEQAPKAKETDTPLGDAASNYLDDPSRMWREANAGVGQALWKIVPGAVRMVNHPVATVRSLGNMPSIADPTGALRATGNTTGFLWDTLSGAKSFTQASEEMNDKVKPDVKRDFNATVGLVKGLTHDWVKTYNEGRPIAATTHAVTDVAMLVLPFLEVGKAAPTAEALNALEKTQQTANATSKLATTGEALSATTDVAKTADELGNATKALGETDDAAKALTEAAEGSKSKPGPLNGVPKEFFDDALAKLESLENPFTSGFGKKTLDKLRKGIDIPGDRAMRPHIDEPLPVGAADIKPQRAVDRALSDQNRQFLDPATNVQNKHLGISGDDIARNRKPLDPVSLADPATDPSVVFTRRFGEITELQKVFKDAVDKIRDIGKYKPTALKGKINANIIEIIRDGTTAEGAMVRDALGKLGYEYVPGKGLTAVKPPPAAPRVASQTLNSAEEALAAKNNGANIRVDVPPPSSKPQTAPPPSAPASTTSATDKAAEIEMLQELEQQQALAEQLKALKKYLPGQ